MKKAILVAGLALASTGLYAGGNQWVASPSHPLYSGYFNVPAAGTVQQWWFVYNAVAYNEGPLGYYLIQVDGNYSESGNLSGSVSAGEMYYYVSFNGTSGVSGIGVSW